MDPAELPVGDEVRGATGVVCCWDSDIVVLLIFGEALDETAGPSSLPLLDGAEVVEEYSVVPKDAELFMENVVIDPRVVIMPIKQTNKKKPINLFPPPIQMFSLYQISLLQDSIK